MLSKLRLDQTKKFELAIATKKSAEMLVAFIQGREHYLGIGSETGGITKWDDLVIQKSFNFYEHIQVKRQHTDFSDAPSERDFVTTRKSKKKSAIGDVPRPLSSLDEAIKSLAEWTAVNDPDNSIPKRSFVIKVPNFTLKIKHEFSISKLYDFCRNEINSTTTEEKLEELAKIDKTVENIYIWLKTWCDFKDWSHMLKALKILDIRNCGNERDLEVETESILNNCFSNSSAVRQQIQLVVDESSSYTGEVTPRQLLSHVHSYLLPNTVTWTQYHRADDNTWEITGTNDLTLNTVEAATQVVPALWDSKQGRMLKFRSNIVINNDGLHRSIIRLFLHFDHLSTAYVNDGDRWQDAARSQVGSTLGLDENDCEKLQIISTLDSFKSSNTRKLIKLKQHEEEAEMLSQAMFNITWKKICDSLNSNLRKQSSTDLRDAIEERWYNWKKSLDINEKERNALIESMLRPVAEDGIIAELRVGPKTAKLIADGVFLLLVVSVALNKAETDWKIVGDDLSVHTIALKYWSGPINQREYPRELAEEGIENLIGRESAKVVILSKVDKTNEDVMNHSLAHDGEQLDNLASPHRPKLLVTNSSKLKSLIKQGSITELQTYFQKELAKQAQSHTINLEISIDE